MQLSFSLALAAVFGALLVWGMVSDVTHRRVSNRLVVAIALVGCLVAATGVTPLTFPQALAGIGLGLALWLPLWLAGLLGAGDVKYFAAGCAWIGPTLAWQSALGVTILGGVLAGLMLVKRLGAVQGSTAAAITASQARALIEGAAKQGGVAAMEARTRTFPYAVPMGIILWLAYVRPALFAW